MIFQLFESFLQVQARKGNKKEEFEKKYSNDIEDVRENIQSILDETELFHGTGAKHYSGNKYDTIDFNKTNDSLTSFLQNGLTPQEDIYNSSLLDIKTGTISLTPLFQYARIYAALFGEQGSKLEYEFGSRKFWWRYLLGKMVLTSLIDKSIMSLAVKKQKEKYQYLVNKNLSPLQLKDKTPAKRKEKYDFRTWVQSFTKQTENFTPLSIMEIVQSDIEGNFPVIIGIKKGIIIPLPLSIKSVSKYETRTNEILPPSSFSHIQVPLKNIDTVKNKMTELGVDIPIIPIEFSEYITGENINISRI